MKLIEKENTEREYGFDGINAIIESEKHGKLLIIDGFGGIDDLEGGSVRFKHGMVVKLKDNDTLSSLNKTVGCYYPTLMNDVCRGKNSGRPVMDWDSWTIENTARSVGLI